MKARYSTVIFDADSTLSRVEGIDWLAQQRGTTIGAQIAMLTERAMDGELPLEAVYERRLDVIRPTTADVAALSAAYIVGMEPGARALIAQLRSLGAHVIILSGGLRPALLPLAHEFAIAEHDLHAVDIEFNDDGSYAGLRGSNLLTQHHGKPELVTQLKLARPLCMIGDGATDAAVAPVADAFIAYTGVARRVAVVAAAAAEAHSYAALSPLLIDGQ